MLKISTTLCFLSFLFIGISQGNGNQQQNPGQGNNLLNVQTIDVQNLFSGIQDFALLAKKDVEIIANCNVQGNIGAKQNIIGNPVGGGFRQFLSGGQVVNSALIELKNIAKSFDDYLLNGTFPSSGSILPDGYALSGNQVLTGAYSVGGSYDDVKLMYVDGDLVFDSGFELDLLGTSPS